MQYLTPIFLIWVLVMDGATANPKQPIQKRPRRKGDAPYALSKRGVERVKQNIRIVDGNIANTERNLRTCKRNQKTIEKEIKEITEMEGEVVSMKKQYLQYMENVKTQNERNEAAIERLTKWKETLLKNQQKGSSAFVNSLRKADREYTNRVLWKKDTENKVRRIRVLQRRANANLSKIQIRRSALKKELDDWLSAENKYKKQLEKLSKRKFGYSKIVEEQTALLYPNKKAPSEQSENKPKTANETPDTTSSKNQ